MKKKWKYCLAIIVTILAASCKIVENTIGKPIMEVFAIPVSNQDLMQLQISLHHYRQLSNKWPNNVEDLIEANKKDSIEVGFSKFHVLHWKPIGDSLRVAYTLHYEESDTIPYKYLSGVFYGLPKIDTAFFSHIQIKGERKDGTMRFESKAYGNKRKKSK
ncbi:hypothetical protein GXP67_35800 [Rhodocytophaga rosea]|uniref:Lipoprotein n=1 Tax=Rhodocytophaga rosea TaxID=2704465 RepID=A0A6C0GUD3_9BACT|nr:hypothetical protein [Rhodocytophaga rosea]QHT71656.1 hypothetical protein GXP67_35800 [Rhodocytophaga rosea]